MLKEIRSDAANLRLEYFQSRAGDIGTDEILALLRPSKEKVIATSFYEIILIYSDITYLSTLDNWISSV